MCSATPTRDRRGTASSYNVFTGFIQAAKLQLIAAVRLLGVEQLVGRHEQR
jgi:hypothetical protein